MHLTLVGHRPKNRQRRRGNVSLYIPMFIWRVSNCFRRDINKMAASVEFEANNVFLYVESACNSRGNVWPRGMRRGGGLEESSGSRLQFKNKPPVRAVHFSSLELSLTSFRPLPLDLALSAELQC